MKCDECNGNMKMEFTKFYRTDFYYCVECGSMIFPRFSPETVTSFNLEKTPRDRLTDYYEWYLRGYRDWCYELDGREDFGELPVYDFSEYNFSWRKRGYNAEDDLHQRVKNVVAWGRANDAHNIRLGKREAARIHCEECPECQYSLEKDCIWSGSRDGKYHDCIKRCEYINSLNPKDPGSVVALKSVRLYMEQHLAEAKHVADTIRIKEFKRDNPSASIREIARALDLKKTYVGNLVKKMRK